MPERLNRDRLYVTVDVLPFTVREGRLCILLSRRAAPPFEGRWALPGRFVGAGEDAGSAVEDLLAEMLPVRDAYLEQLYTFTDVDRDPRGRVISVACLAIIPWQRLESLPDARRGGWGLFGIHGSGGTLTLTGESGEIAGEGLAFDHGRIVETGINRLRGKIEYTDIGFRFLNDPGAFTLGEIQTVFEAVLDRTLDSSNFRRFIRTRYLETGRITPSDRADRQGRGRPAALYTWKK